MVVRDGITLSSWSLRSLSSTGPISDFLVIKIYLHNRILSLLNVYSPPFPSRAERFDPSLLPSFLSTFIFGDFNTLHPSWGAQRRTGFLCSANLSWLLSSLECLNDPSDHTLLHRALAPGLPLTSLSLSFSLYFSLSLSPRPFISQMCLVHPP